MYHNNGVETLVTNANSTQKIIETRGRLIKKADPIYSEPLQNVHPLDYRAQFYTSDKQFLGYYFDTFWFNITVIWLLTLILSTTLYFNVFRSVVAYFEDISISGRRKKLMARFQTKIPDGA